MRRRFDPVHMGSPRFVTREHGPFLVTDAWFPAFLALPAHEHERAVVAVTLDGAWSSVMMRRPHGCAAGSLLVEPAGERHSNHFGAEGGRVLIVQPDLARRSEYEFEMAARALDAPTAFPCARAPAVGRRLLDEIAAPDAWSPLAIEALCLELVVLTGRAADRLERQPPRWLARAIEYLHARVLEPVRLSQVAAAAGVHPAHLAREFRRHHRASIGSYVRGLRLAWASEQLVRSDRPIAEIAAEAGFADQSHFTRAFRRHNGRTPAAFRAARAPTA